MNNARSIMASHPAILRMRIMMMNTTRNRPRVPTDKSVDYESGITPELTGELLPLLVKELLIASLVE
jgi:hypothetical protein